MLKNSVTTVAAFGALAVTMSASASLIAGWTITAAIPTGTIGNNYSVGVANMGDQTAGSGLSAYHAVAAAAYSSPAGNGSQYSFSSNNWSVGDYYQVTVDVDGYQSIDISWDQTRSGTGPAAFELVYVDGTGNQTQLATYTVIQAGLAGSNTTSWNATTYQAAFTKSHGPMDFAQSTVTFRFRSTVTTAAAGTNRIDNIMISGTQIPAPGAMALLGLAGMITSRRRR